LNFKASSFWPSLQVFSGGGVRAGAHSVVFSPGFLGGGGQLSVGCSCTMNTPIVY
jgi:hypothetical protein